MTASSPPKSDAAMTDSSALPIASRYVRDLLNRHNVPFSQHVTTIADVMKVGYSPAYRRMNGTVAWELEEIEAVAKHFGETLAEVFAAQRSEDYVPALLVLGGIRVPCQLIPGGVLREPDPGSLVAVKLGEQWLVTRGSDAGLGQAFDVKRLVVSGAADRRWRIAVLDDDVSESDSLAEHFSDRGCEVDSFSRVEDLVGRMKSRPFDGYVVDWMLSEGSAAELVGMIRADDRECPIAVLTGKIASDVMVEPAVAEAVSTYKLLFFEKPTRLPIISAQMLQALAGR